MHSVCWTVPTGMWYNLQGKVLLSTCGGNVPGCFQIVLHPNDTTDFHQLYIPTITKQTIKIITITTIKKKKIRASSWSTRRCSDLAGRPLKSVCCASKEKIKTIIINHFRGLGWIYCAFKYYLSLWNPQKCFVFFVCFLMNGCLYQTYRASFWDETSQAAVKFCGGSMRG